MYKIKVMIAEDTQMFRDLLVSAIESNNRNISIVGIAENGRILLDLVKRELPDVLLLDLNMPEMDGIDVLKEIKNEHHNVKTIILSNYYSEYFVVQVILNGGSAYLKKDSAFSEVIRAIESVHRDGYYFNQIVSREILTELKTEKKFTTLDNKKFSERELEVLKLICEDMPFEQIADRLNISASTVRFHKTNLLHKTESPSLVSLVKYALRQGIISNEERKSRTRQ